MSKCRFLLAGVLLLLAVGCSSDPTGPRPQPEPKPKDPPPPPKTGLLAQPPSWRLAAAVSGAVASPAELTPQATARPPIASA
ncbi:MAG: hypothetical protein IRZ00_03620 [Gemmatimonadetes bacterium]|nr:hypothetical protein [Gemmatimonadota bacterium]